MRNFAIKWDALVGLVILICSLTANVMLARQVSTLRTTIYDLKTDHSLRPGDLVQPLEATTVDGTPARISSSDSSLDTVLYVFSPTCHWCKANLPDLHALSSGAKGHFRLVGLSLSQDGLKEYISEQHLDFPIFTNVRAQDRSKYYLGGTPETIVISPSGRVRNVWMGAYQDPQRAEIEKLMNVSLPRCCS